MSAGDAATAPPSTSDSTAAAADESRDGAGLLRWAKDPFVIGALVLWIGTLFALRSLHFENTLPVVTMRASDQIALPGATVELTAEVSRLLPDGLLEREGIEVDLRLATEAPGTGLVKTDAQGIARRSVIAPSEPGVVRFAVDVGGEYSTAIGIRFDPTLTVLDPARPVVLCEIDALSPPESEWAEQFGDLGQVTLDLIPDAIRSVQALSEKRQLVFLHLGPTEISDAWRGAFRLRQLPAIPILSPQRPAESSDDVRARVLAEWNGTWGEVGAVITRSATGCFVYRGANLPTVVLAGPPCDGARSASNWSEVQSTIEEWVPTD